MANVLPTKERIEEFFESVEEVVWQAAPDLPNVRVAVHRLYQDVSRLFPQAVNSLPDIKIPNLGAFEVPPPPPPPPTPKSILEKATDWASAHKWTTASIGIGLIGAHLLVGYSALRYKRASARRYKATSGNERRQVVVVLGGDSPLGLPLILDLEKNGYIVITSVSAREAGERLEAQSHGYVRALVLDPAEPDAIPLFLRAFSSTLSRRFPISAAGDPHASVSSLPYLYSIISLLTLPSQIQVPAPGPLEHLSLQDDYSTYLQMTHITPLQVIQALLPILRTSSARARDLATNRMGRKSIIVCLPATDARVGLPFASAQAMSAAATLRGVEVLRREVRAAALTDESDSMKNIKVVTVDVGAINVDHGSPDQSLTALDAWTPSEKIAYGAAYMSVAQGVQFGSSRKPSDVSVFVKKMVNVVGDGRRASGGCCGAGLRCSSFREWIRGDMVVVGAGARTYRMASHLPALLLDTLLNLPHFLISVRNALLPIPPAAGLPYPPPVPPTNANAKESEAEDEESDPEEQHEHTDVSSDIGSEADVESNAGSGVGESWISLKEHDTESPERT